MAGRTLIRIVIAAAAVAVLSAVLVTGGATGAAKAPIQVSADDDFFEPKKVKIGQGEKVQWTNDGSEDHTVKFKGEKDRVFGPGESVSKKFKDVGKFQYHCTLHAGMTGTVVAKGRPPSSRPKRSPPARGTPPTASPSPARRPARA